MVQYRLFIYFSDENMIFFFFCRAGNINMATKYIIGSVAASFAFAYVCGVYFADRKVLGGQISDHS